MRTSAKKDNTVVRTHVYVVDVEQVDAGYIEVVATSREHAKALAKQRFEFDSDPSGYKPTYRSFEVKATGTVDKLGRIRWFKE